MTEPRIRAVRGTTSVPEPAIAALFRQWREPMARLAYVLTSDGARADEIVQEAFLKLHGAWDHVENPVAYLRTSVVNGCRTLHRRNAVERRRPLERAGVSELVADELSDALAKLDLKYRAVLALKYFCDLSDDEIGSIIGIRPASVRTRIHRALAQLRQEIER